MKAVKFNEYGGPEVLQIAEFEEPHPAPGQIRVAVTAAGVNAFDWKLRSGMMAKQIPLQFPAGVGMDGAGVVDELGEGVTDVVVGDRVCGIGSGTYAEFAVLTSWTRPPEDLGLVEAADYPVPCETAIRCLGQLGIRRGQTLIVSGASGGVGSAALQIAVDRGINVIATASAANQNYLRSLGARATTYGDGLTERVRALAPHGVDAALHLAGTEVVPGLIELTGDPQKVLSTADPSLVRLGAQVATRPGDPAAALQEAGELIEAGALRIPVQRAFTLTEVQQAHGASQGGHVVGRFVLEIR